MISNPSTNRFENSSVKSTPQESTPKSVCFFFCFFQKYCQRWYEFLQFISINYLTSPNPPKRGSKIFRLWQRLKGFLKERNFLLCLKNYCLPLNISSVSFRILSLSSPETVISGSLKYSSMILRWASATFTPPGFPSSKNILVIANKS